MCKKKKKSLVKACTRDKGLFTINYCYFYNVDKIQILTSVTHIRRVYNAVFTCKIIEVQICSILCPKSHGLTTIQAKAPKGGSQRGHFSVENFFKLYIT